MIKETQTNLTWETNCDAASSMEILTLGMAQLIRPEIFDAVETTVAVAIVNADSLLVKSKDSKERQYKESRRQRLLVEIEKLNSELSDPA